LRAFSVTLTTTAHSPQQLTVVWNLSLQSDSGGPYLHHQCSTATISAILYIATSSRVRGTRSSAYADSWIMPSRW